MYPGLLTFHLLFFYCLCVLVDGIVDHADSVGNGGRYGMGDLQWMTAGEGIVHSEMFPLVNADAPNPTRFFQIWLNLPAKNKMVSPSFAMFWANEVPKYKTTDGLASATIWAGHYYGVTKETQNNPPPDSWATDPENDVALVHITIQPGGKLTLPEAHEKTVNRSLFYIEGAAGVLVDGKAIGTKQSLVLDPTVEAVLENPVSANGNAEFLWMQGKPIEEPVAQYGPFVMNTEKEIRRAMSDYRSTEFGGWPWPRGDMVFPADKGRFASVGGKETFPPKDDDTCESK